jgi:adenine deaminase
VDNPLGLITSLPLPVVPRYRPTDMGLVDVESQKLVPAFNFLE